MRRLTFRQGSDQRPSVETLLPSERPGLSPLSPDPDLGAPAPEMQGWWVSVVFCQRLVQFACVERGGSSRCSPRDRCTQSHSRAPRVSPPRAGSSRRQAARCECVASQHRWLRLGGEVRVGFLQIDQGGSMQHANQHQHITLESSELGTCCLSEITSTHHISLSLDALSHTLSDTKSGYKYTSPRKKHERGS